MGELLGGDLCLLAGEGNVAHEGAQSLFVASFIRDHNTKLQIRVVESTTRAIKVDVILVEGKHCLRNRSSLEDTSTFPSDLIRPHARS